MIKLGRNEILSIFYVLLILFAFEASCQNQGDRRDIDGQVFRFNKGIWIHSALGDSYTLTDDYVAVYKSSKWNKWYSEGSVTLRKILDLGPNVVFKFKGGAGDFHIYATFKNRKLVKKAIAVGLEGINSGLGGAAIAGTAASSAVGASVSTTTILGIATVAGGGVLLADEIFKDEVKETKAKTHSNPKKIKQASSQESSNSRIHKSLTYHSTEIGFHFAGSSDSIESQVWNYAGIFSNRDHFSFAHFKTSSDLTNITASKNLLIRNRYHAAIQFQLSNESEVYETYTRYSQRSSLSLPISLKLNKWLSTAIALKVNYDNQRNLFTQNIDASLLYQPTDNLRAGVALRNIHSSKKNTDQVGLSGLGVSYRISNLNIGFEYINADDVDPYSGFGLQYDMNHFCNIKTGISEYMKTKFVALSYNGLQVSFHENSADHIVRLGYLLEW